MKFWIYYLFLAVGYLSLIGGPFLGNYLITRGHEYKRQFTVKSVLDHQSLGFLQQLSGLMIASDDFDIAMIRFLIQQKIIKNEVFPSSPITYGYCLTPFGRRVLSDLGVKMFPEIIVEMHRIRFWAGYLDKFKIQKEKFKKQFGYDFDANIDKVIKLIPRQFISSIIGDKEALYEQKIDIFGRFLRANLSYDDKINVFKKARILN